MAVVMLPPRRPPCGNLWLQFIDPEQDDAAATPSSSSLRSPSAGCREQPFAATMAALYVPLSASIHDLPQSQTGRD